MLQRTNTGLAAARARGRKGGRPKGVDQKKQKAALALKMERRILTINDTITTL
jgi:hypothetical protein